MQIADIDLWLELLLLVLGWFSWIYNHSIVVIHVLRNLLISLLLWTLKTSRTQLLHDSSLFKFLVFLPLSLIKRKTLGLNDWLKGLYILGSSEYLFPELKNWRELLLDGLFQRKRSTHPINQLLLRLFQLLDFLVFFLYYF